MEAQLRKRLLEAVRPIELVVLIFTMIVLYCLMFTRLFHSHSFVGNNRTVEHNISWLIRAGVVDDTAGNQTLT
jgi:hypothetical protein